MSGIAYDVRTRYSVQDDASSKIAKIGSQAGIAGMALEGLSKVAGAAGAAFDRLAGAAVGALKLGGAAALGGAVMGIKTGLVDVNAKLEDASIGFATIFNMLGASTNFDHGLGMAKGLMSDIRKDAASLPGEFGDFVGIAQTIAAPLLHAGKGVEQIRNLTRDTAVAGAAMGVAFDQAGREMAELVEGRAGTHNKLGMRLGITTHTKVGSKDFNKATSAERFDFITKHLQKAKESLPAFQKSWSGLTSTMADGVKNLLGRATLPLFDRLKKTVGGINNLLDSQKATALADTIGKKLVAGYERAAEASAWIASHWSEIREAGTKFGNDLHAGFAKAWPLAQKLGTWLAQKLHDPGKFLKQLAAVRIALGGVQMLPAAMKLGDAIGKALSVGGAASSGAAALGGGGSGAAAAGSGASAAAAAGLGVAAGTAAVALLGLAGAADVVTMKQGEHAGAIEFMGRTGKQIWGETGKIWTDVMSRLRSLGDNLVAIFRPLADLVGITLIGALAGLGVALKGVIGAIDALASACRAALAKIGLADAERSENGGGDWQRDITMGVIAQRRVTVGKFLGDLFKDAQGLGADAATKGMVKKVEPSKLGGSGKTSITNNNYFTVLQENDPERFAKAVATHIERRLRHPTKSPGVMTYLPGQ